MVLSYYALYIWNVKFKNFQVISNKCIYNLIAIFDGHGSYHSVKINRYYCLFLQFKVNSFKVIIIFIPSNIGSFSDLKTIMDNSGKSNDSNPHSQNNQIYRESVESRRQSHLNQSQGRIYNIIKCFKNKNV